ncbi:RHS repeat-associated core domain-containing protein [Hamadaea sp. NPDC050747]|uniref:RHS repeat domain-containing protein n=1 Tax=Hamadaea sp. NPDC050747 TaxID=3155789 RepID=UPI0033DB55F0
MRRLHARPVILLTAALLVFSLTQAVPAAAKPYIAPSAQDDGPVGGHSFTGRPPGTTTLSRFAPGAVSWPKPGRAEVSLPGPQQRQAGTEGAVQVPGSPVRLTAGPDAPAAVSVEWLDGAPAGGGGEGPAVRLSRSDGRTTPGTVRMSVGYAGFRWAGGADWASRLALYSDGARLASTNDVRSHTVSADVAVDTDTVVVLAAGPAGAGGDYRTTSLAPSSTWSAGGNSGDFAWSYPLRLPSTVAGPSPAVAMSYSSASVDGRMASANNQASWVGEGFDFQPGAIERRYRGCADDMGTGANNTTKTGDLCWQTDNAWLALPGHAGELIRDASDPSRWHLRDDDGTYVQRKTGGPNGDNDGEWWLVRATDGTQYWFGGRTGSSSTLTVPVYGNHTGEPCHTSSFTTSACTQAYRWQLDYVVDTHGNVITYTYAKATNKYGRNNTPADDTVYDRDGYLTAIEYGGRAGDTTSAPVRVSFAVADRCLSGCATKDAAHWPDVPWDRECTAGTCGVTQNSPTFYSTVRLASVTTQVLSGSAYQDVERWTLTHAFPASDQPTLWLDKISHSGLAGGIATVPDTVFTGVAMPNRVDTNSDQYPSMTRYRLKTITSETGGRTELLYSPADCVAGTRVPDTAKLQDNVLRCYPVKWTPDGAAKPITDFFHRYLVTDVVEADLSGQSTRVITHYDYLGDPAWHYTDDDGIIKPADKTWSVWRGYSAVRVTIGDPGRQTVQEHRFFRGMNGDKLPTGTRTVQLQAIAAGSVPAAADEDAYAGMLRESIVYNAPGGAEVSATAYEPWRSDPTATRTINGSTVTARLTDVAATHTRTTLDGGRAPQTTTETTVFDGYGLPIQVEDRGDDTVTGDEQCTLTAYVRNTTAWIVDLTSSVRTFALPCDQTGRGDLTGDDIIDAQRFSYDQTTWNTAPTRGDLTLTEVLLTITGGVIGYQDDTRTTYDPRGRALDVTDRRGNVIRTRYTPELTGPVTAVTITSPLGWTTTTTLQPAWSLPLSTVDPDGRRTDLSYDPLGRLTDVWLPGRAKATDTASLRYAYTVRTSAPSVVATTKLTPSGGYTTSYAFYDGLARPRQTQIPGPAGGTLVSDTVYDSAGRAYKIHQPYPITAAPSANLFVPTSTIPTVDLQTFDGAGRVVAAIRKTNTPAGSDGGTELWRTTTGYGGDHEDVTPPNGGIATSTYFDAKGRIVQLRQLRPGGYDTTSYTYDRKDQLIALTDPAGARWTYSYDLLGRQTTVADPDQGVTSTEYNRFDDPQTVTDSRGVTLATTYDTLGRRETVRDGTVTGPVRTRWVYDQLGDGSSAKGKLVKTTRYADSSEYTVEQTGFTPDGQPTGVVYTIPDVPGNTGLSGRYTYAYSYHPDGSLATVDLPAAGDLGGERLTLGYTATGLPTTLSTDVGGTYVTGTDYTKYGELAVLHLRSNGGPQTDIARYYDSRTRRLTQLLTVAATPGTIADQRYAYDDAGNVTQISDLATGDHQCFTADQLRRLTQAWTPADGDCTTAPNLARLSGPAPYWHTYSYDTAGNRSALVQHGTTDKTTTYTVKAGTHQLTATAGATSSAYTYDQTGNTLTRTGPAGQQTMTWDPEGHLATVQDPTGTTSYLYDSEGNRLLRRDPKGTTLYLPMQELRTPKGANAAAGVRYYTHAGQTVATRSAAGVTWLSGDHHGTAQISIDAARQTVAIRRETPFGQQRSTGGDWPSTMDKGFVGGTNDDTGLIHLGAREYDPAIGRFISVDPIIDTADPQQLHGYAYANNAPVTASDPDGLSPDWFNDIVNGAIGAAFGPAAGPIVAEPAGVVADAWWTATSWYVGQLWEHAGDIAFVAGATALICMEIVICAPLAPFAGGVAVGFGILSAIKSCSGGDTVDCTVGIGTSIIGLLCLGACAPRVEFIDQTAFAFSALWLAWQGNRSLTEYLLGGDRHLYKRPKVTAGRGHATRTGARVEAGGTTIVQPQPHPPLRRPTPRHNATGTGGTNPKSTSHGGKTVRSGGKRTTSGGKVTSRSSTGGKTAQRKAARPIPWRWHGA